MPASISFRTALPRIHLAAVLGEVSADCFVPLASGVRSIPGRGCGRLRDRFPVLSKRCRYFGPRVRACPFRIRDRRLESGRGWLTAVIADGLRAFGRDVFDGGAEKVGGFEDFKVALGVPTAAGAVGEIMKCEL